MSKTYAEALADELSGKEVEIYCGDLGETHIFSETQKTQKHIIRGVIKSANGDLLLVRVSKPSNMWCDVYLNGWNIKTVVKISDPLFIMDIYEDERFGKKK